MYNTRRSQSTVAHGSPGIGFKRLPVFSLSSRAYTFGLASSSTFSALHAFLECVFRILA